MSMRTDDGAEALDADRGRGRDQGRDQGRDRKPGGLRMNYEVPLVWLISGLIVVCAQAVNAYFAQQRQSELITEQSALIKDLALQIKSMGTALSAKDLKDVEHDIRITDHERRLQSLETKTKP